MNVKNKSTQNLIWHHPQSVILFDMYSVKLQWTIEWNEDASSSFASMTTPFLLEWFYMTTHVDISYKMCDDVYGE